MDLIDSAWPVANSDGDSDGDTGSGDYTTFAYVNGVGNGATVTPAKGDTGKRLFLPNAGRRLADSDVANYGGWGYFWSVTQDPTTTSYAWRFDFSGSAPSGVIYPDSKLLAFSLRCVRS